MTDARRPTELEVAVEHLRAVVARTVFEVNYTQPVGRPIPPSDTAALYEAACLVVALSETDLINCAESTASHRGVRNNVASDGDMSMRVCETCGADFWSRANDVCGTCRREPPSMRLTMKKNPIMKYFSYAHLPAHLREISEPVCKLAEEMNAKLAPGAELSAGLRKLLEAKDCLVRAGLRQDDVGLLRGGEDEHVEKTGGES